MRTRLHRLAALAVLVGYGGVSALAGECLLAQLPIDPVEPGRHDLFVGKGKTVELRFHSERQSAAVAVFPEPPLTVQRLAAGGSCDIDGGVWVRKAVYLSGDERVLLVQEYSGSNDQLVFYDTADCRKRRELDVSGARWAVTGDRIAVGYQCTGDDVASCRRHKEFVLDASCRLRPGSARRQ